MTCDILVYMRCADTGSLNSTYDGIHTLRTMYSGSVRVVLSCYPTSLPVTGNVQLYLLRRQGTVDTKYETVFVIVTLHLLSVLRFLHVVDIEDAGNRPWTHTRGVGLP
jgi:hypothetical protein